jgi:phage tail-like protein
VANESEYPYLNLLFRLSLDGEPMVDFAECSGLSMETTTEEYVEGGENRFAHKFPTRGQPPNLVIKRGITTTRELWEWFASYLESGAVEPKSGQVELYASPDHSAEPVRVWAFTHAYPVKWTGPDLNALSPAVAFETLELVHRGIRVAD